MNGGGGTTDVGTALVEIAKALNRIADKMPEPELPYRRGGAGAYIAHPDLPPNAKCVGVIDGFATWVDPDAKASGGNGS